MFERFSDRARRVMVLAQEESRMLGHDYIGTEHLLLGLLHEGEGLAARALESLGITEGAARERVEEMVGHGQATPSGSIPFTPQANKVLQLALREAVQLGHAYIGTEHLLLGLIRGDEGPAQQVLTALGAEPSRVRQQVIVLLHGHQGEPGNAGAAAAVGLAGRGTRKQLSQVLARLSAIEWRLSALERRVGTGTSDLDEAIAQVRRDKESAIDAHDFESAAALRDTEKQLLAERASRQQEWATARMDLPSLSTEIERLRELLRRHGIEPQDGAA
jgi:hypothetical protein